LLIPNAVKGYLFEIPEKGRSSLLRKFPEHLKIIIVYYSPTKRQSPSPLSLLLFSRIPPREKRVNILNSVTRWDYIERGFSEVIPPRLVYKGDGVSSAEE
jgi:hypothetical protein